jgi:tetratricopeptide (TPR) repeat protein
MSSPYLKNVLRILLLLLCQTHITLSLANGKEQLIALGDAAYGRKAYDSAISYYEQVTAGKSADATTLYKLGNAHYRLKHTGEAVLAYERALLRAPGFAPASRNVNVIQQQVMPHNREIFFIRWWHIVAAPELSNFWAVLAIIIFAALLGMIAWNHYKHRKPGWQRPQIIASALILAALFVVLSLAGVWRNMPKANAVVMRPDTKFRPTVAGAKGNAISLPEGLIVKILNAGKEEVIIALPDGQEGFVQRFDIAVVE